MPAPAPAPGAKGRTDPPRPQPTGPRQSHPGRAEGDRRSPWPLEPKGGPTPLDPNPPAPGSATLCGQSAPPARPGPWSQRENRPPSTPTHRPPREPPWAGRGRPALALAPGAKGRTDPPRPQPAGPRQRHPVRAERAPRPPRPLEPKGEPTPLDPNPQAAAGATL